MSTSDQSKLVLIVDDDEELLEELSLFLNNRGVNSISAKNAEEAKSILLRANISLLVCDVVMPGESGLELTQWAIKNQNIPVILLTSLDDIIDRVTGLEIGADDYVSKPFNPRELLARINAVLRRFVRAESMVDGSEFSEGFTLNKADLLISPSGERYKLRNSEAKLLRVLINNQGTPVSRQQLYGDVLQRSWNPEDRSIDNIVVRLRCKLQLEQSSPSLIQTVRQKGYLLCVNSVRLI